MAFVHHALSHLCSDERDAGFFDQLAQDPRGHFAVGAGADHQHRAARRFKLGHGGTDRLVFSHGAPAQTWGNRRAFGVFGGDVLWKLQVYRAWFLFFGQANGFADARRDVIRRGELVGVLGERRHHRAHVENLETTLLGFLDRFLAGDHHHRHTTQIGVRTGSYQVGRSGT
ncbi:hypothetical protein D3C86_1707460 [compost metagenome]